MPLYNSQVLTNSPLKAISVYDPPATLINAEQLGTGNKSVAVAIQQLPNRTTSLAFEFTFAAAPGAFNYQIQAADTDVDAAYFTEGSGTVTAATAEADGTSRARVELSPWVASLVRILVSSENANAKNATVTVKAI